MKHVDVIIIGAGAAGLMCSIEAGKRERSVLLLDQANKPGKKILMSGGGRCNFTNYNISPERYISHNPHFCKSALSRYTQWDFIKLVEKHKIPYHEKTLGQLFCDNKSSDIVNMLLSECQQAKVDIRLNVNIENINKNQNKYILKTNFGEFTCESLVIACGGLSIPTMGASPLGYNIAKQFGIKVWPTKAGLVPFTLHVKDKDHLSDMSGVSFDSLVSNEKIRFRESSLITHRGLSGPAMLQLSSYWTPGESILINLLPEKNMVDMLTQAKTNKTLKQVKSLLSDYLPKRLIEKIFPEIINQKKGMALTLPDIEFIAQTIHNWKITPNGTEGYRTAEVTLGGVDCNAVSSKTFESTDHKGLYFIGEVLDVSGWLGGYNFQWAWASGHAAGQVV